MFSLQECVTLVTSASCQSNEEGDGNRASISVRIPSTCMKCQNRGWIFCPRFPCMTQTSCLTTAFSKTLTCVCVFTSGSCLMPETAGQRKLRLTKERLTNELNQRTARRISELKEQGNQGTPCLTACLFCFWLLVANLLFYQWLYNTGRLNLK